MKTKNIVLLMCFAIIFMIGSLFAVEVHEAKAEYPEAPINLIVPFPAGGVTDIGARAFADALEKLFKRPVVVVNKVGGGTTIGGYAVASAKPDGYTLGWFPAMASIPEVYSYFIKAPYTSKDLIPVCRIYDVIGTISVKGDSPINSFSELIEYMKKHPGTTWATHSKSAGGYIMLRQVAKRQGVKITEVLLEGDVKIIPAILGGHVVVGTPVYTPAKPLIESKQLKVLALLTTQKKRIEFLPDIPVITEFGYEVVGGYYNGLFAPKGTSPEIVSKLSNAATTICKDPAFIRKIEDLGLLLRFEDSKTFERSLEEEKTRLMEFFREEGFIEGPK